MTLRPSGSTTVLYWDEEARLWRWKFRRRDGTQVGGTAKTEEEARHALTVARIRKPYITPKANERYIYRPKLAMVKDSGPNQPPV